MESDTRDFTGMFRFTSNHYGLCSGLMHLRFEGCIFNNTVIVHA